MPASRAAASVDGRSGSETGREGRVDAATIPYRPVVDVEALTPLRVGGTPAGHAAASADYWPRVLETLRSLE